MREIAFDTETTGLFHDQGDRIIEVGCVELHNHIPSGRTFRRLINPGRPVSADTVRITGITDAMLEHEPPFALIVDELLDFLGDAVIVAHNAGFDRGFLNAELLRCGRPVVPEARWVDTVALARARNPGAQASLDALCKRFGINNEARNFHGALLDAQLLAEVYLELRGGRARGFDFAEPSRAERVSAVRVPARTRPVALTRTPDPAEIEAHAAFIASLGGADGPLWTRQRRDQAS